MGYTQAGRLYAAKKYEQALAAYQKYLKDTPDIRPATRALAEQKIGMCLAGLKQYDKALAKLDHVLAACKDSPATVASTHVCRGEVLMAMGRFDEAEKAVYLGLKSGGLSATALGQAYAVLTQIRLQQGDPRAALPYAKRMFQVAHLRGSLNAINQVCDCYKRIDGDIDPNVREFLECQKFGPNGRDGKPGTADDLKNPLDDVLALDEPELAKLARAAIAETKPLNPASRGRLWMLAGDYPRALHEFMNAYAAAPFETRNSRGPRRMTQATGDIATALKAIDGHVHRANRFLLYQQHGPAGPDGKPGTEDDLTNPLKEFSKEYWAKHAPPDKKLDAAFQAAIEKEPDTYLGHRARGRLYLAWGKPDKGLEEMKTAFKLCSLTRKELVRAINDVALAIKAQDGDIFRANRYLLFKKYGPKGKDGVPGTEDDLADPLAE